MRIGEKLISSPWLDPIFGKFECSCSTVKSYRDIIMCFEKSPLAKSQDNHFRKNLKFLFVVVDI